MRQHSCVLARSRLCASGELHARTRDTCRARTTQPRTHVTLPAPQRTTATAAAVSAASETEMMFALTCCLFVIVCYCIPLVSVCCHVLLIDVFVSHIIVNCGSLGKDGDRVSTAR